MERTFSDAGRRVEAHPEWSQGDVISRRSSASEGTAETIGGELAKGPGALQSALKQGAVTIGHGMQERGDEVIAYTRRQPVRALMTAAGIGLVVGLSLALGARAGRQRSGWLAQLTRANPRRSLLARPAAGGWRNFLKLE